MAVTPFNLNLTLPISNFTLDLPSATEYITEMPAIANSSTGNFFAIIIMLAVFVILYLVLSDKTPFGDFKYSDGRALNVALGITSLWGITNMEIGYYTNFISVATVVILFMLSWILILAYENRE